MIAHIVKLCYMCVACLLCTYTVGFAQSTAPQYHAIEKEKWQKAIDGLDYTEASDKPKQEDAPEPIQTENHSKFITPTWLKYAGYVVVIGLLVFILLKIFGKGLFAKNKKIRSGKEVTIQDLDDKPMESELDKFLREAISKKDYRLAVRVYYLMVLKTLHDEKLITWKKNKTNFDYFNEINLLPYSGQFNTNTKVFEYIWYGNRLLEENEFNAISPSFTKLISVIHSK